MSSLQFSSRQLGRQMLLKRLRRRILFSSSTLLILGIQVIWDLLGGTLKQAC